MRSPLLGQNTTEEVVEVHVPGAYVASKGTSCSRVRSVMSWPVPTIRMACPASSTTIAPQACRITSQQFSFWLGKGFAVAKHPLTG